ncbi:MAG: class I SAM-dependent methyltransferase [Elusimicrobiota bacterium]|jgi:SAM-dependent methyltransferase
MKVRDSGMPEEELWRTFFDPALILAKLGLTSKSGDVVEFGCGFGLFTLPAARITSGIVHAFDIDPTMVKETTRKVVEQNIVNVRCSQRDFVSDGTGLTTASIGYAMLFNILHAEDPLVLLREAFRALKPGGKVGIIHWNYDAATPRGPAMDIRPRPGECGEWTTEAGFKLIIPHIDLPPYHYGLVGQKPA